MLQMLPVSHIFARDDARKLDDAVVRNLMSSIQDVGLINPLRVRPASRHVEGVLSDAYEVIAGGHRLRALSKLGVFEAQCDVIDCDETDAELAMIDENLMRAELSPADRARSVARRKTLYLLKHPQTAHGSNQHTRSGQDVHSFADATAEAIGKDARTVRRDAERGEKISERALSLVAGTALDTGAYLDKLKKLGPQEQERRVQRELAETRKPVSPAPVPRNEFESFQAWLTKLTKVFEAGSQEWREQAQEHLYPDIPIMDRRHA